MNITVERVDGLRAADYNPRISLSEGMKEYQKLKKSIETFGLVEPLIVNDRTGVLVGGHQRLTVLKDLGIENVEVVHVDLDEAHEKALNVALNKISGKWDADKLEDLLRDLDLNFDIDVELTGFDTDELNTMFTGAMNELSSDDDTSEEDETVVDDLVNDNGTELLTDKAYNKRIEIKFTDENNRVIAVYSCPIKEALERQYKRIKDIDELIKFVNKIKEVCDENNSFKA